MKRFFLFAIVGVLAACTAGEQVKQGDVNEFCKLGDSDCRPGLVCEEGVCQLAGEQPSNDCDAVCARLDECGAAESSCVVDCRATTRDWSIEAKELFGECAANITCEEAQTSFVPQLCYERIPLDPDRRTQCDFLVGGARECTDSADFEALQTACYRLARTGDEEAWSRLERCESALQVGICSGIATCFNEELSLDPEIDLGNATLNSEDPA